MKILSFRMYILYIYKIYILYMCMCMCIRKPMNINNFPPKYQNQQQFFSIYLFLYTLHVIAHTNKPSATLFWSMYRNLYVYYILLLLYTTVFPFAINNFLTIYNSFVYMYAMYIINIYIYMFYVYMSV